MNSDIFLFLCFLVFTRVQAADVSPIGTYVDEIDQLIPPAQKRNFTVKFLKDPKNWTNLLEKAAIKDPSGMKKVFKEILKSCFDVAVVISPSVPHGKAEIFYIHLGNFLEYGISAEEVIADPLKTLESTYTEKFNVVTFVSKLAATLKAYNDVMEDSVEKTNFERAKPISELAALLASSLKNLSSDKWSKEFYGKIQNAANNEDYGEGGEGGYLLYIILFIIFLLAIIAVVLAFVIHRRKIVHS
jgi:hypothetical protein